MNRKVSANTVYFLVSVFPPRYNEYISDKNHVHMNGTCWTTLSAFVQTLASNGIVEAEETERVGFGRVIHD